MTSMEMDNLMDFAARTAARAGEITLEHFGSATVERKGDGSEVTAADRASEEYLRTAIAEAFPDDGILGEEGTAVEARGRRRWVIDPIDATRSFASGVPLFGVLLALEEDGRPILGCCHLPALRETVVAARGAGAWWNGRRAAVSAVERLEEARVVTSGLEYWRDWGTDQGRAGWTRLVGRTRFARTWGDCYGYMLVATGRVEVYVDIASGARWDFTPMLPILEEAGGRFTTLANGPVRSWTTALASNGRVHAAVSACWDGAADALLQLPAVVARHGT